jgi:glycosyltransferase involved in cell wall biosynthesis
MIKIFTIAEDAQQVGPRRHGMQRFSSQAWHHDEVEDRLSAEAIALTARKKRVHVLFLIDHLLARGGGESNLLKLVQLLPRENIRCSVATFRIDPDIQKSIPVPVYVLPLRRVFGWSGFRSAVQLYRLIRREKIDIVQTYFETSNLWGGLMAKLSGAVLLSSRRDMGILRSRKHRLGYQVINRIADRVLAVSQEVKRFCVDQEGFAPEKVSVVYNGVDLEQIQAGAEKPNPFADAEWAKAKNIVTCVANVRRVKGIDLFMRAAQIVLQEMPGTVFLMAGTFYETEYAAQVRALTSELGLEKNVRLLEFIDDPLPLLKMSNVFCLLSRSEGFCNALLEAMACGVPSVVTRVGGNPEAIDDGENGFLVPVEDYETAAQRVLHLLRNPEQAKRIGEAGRTTAYAKFTADAMVKNLLNLYADLMKERK